MTLYNLFVGATMPRPRNDVGLRQLPDPAVGLLLQLRPEPLVYVPLGSNTAITAPATERLPQPATDPGGRPTDPHFLVRSAGSTAPQVAPTIDSRRPDLRERQDRSGCPATGSSPSAPTWSATPTSRCG